MTAPGERRMLMKTGENGVAGVSEELNKLAELRDRGILTEEEFGAQKSALLRHGSFGTSASATSKPLQKHTTRNAALAIVGVCILLAMFSNGSNTNASGDSSDTATAAASVPPVEVSAMELFRAYDANEAAAQERYGKRPLLVSGTVSGVDLDLTDDPVVELKTDNQFMPASANLVDESKPKASGLSKGQSVKVLCLDVTEVIGRPMLHDCQLQ